MSEPLTGLRKAHASAPVAKPGRPAPRRIEALRVCEAGPAGTGGGVLARRPGPASFDTVDREEPDGFEGLAPGCRPRR
ncbi:MAG: hypothetical protein ACOC0V_03270 [Oceanicaulis sp.]